PPARRAGDEIRAPAKLVEAILMRSRTWVRFPPSPLISQNPRKPGGFLGAPHELRPLSTRRALPRQTWVFAVAGSDLRARSMDHQQPEHERQRAHERGGAEDPPHDPCPLVVAGRTAHEDPGAVQSTQDH